MPVLCRIFHLEACSYPNQHLNFSESERLNETIFVEGRTCHRSVVLWTRPDGRFGPTGGKRLNSRSNRSA